MQLTGKPAVLDLFCGAGGMSEGFIQAGFSVPFASDHSQDALETYTNRHRQLGYNLKYHLGDIRELSNGTLLKEFLGNEHVRVIAGGPPCQGFSVVGKRAENDSRNELFLEFLNIISLVKPDYFLMENVEGILSYRFKSIRGLSGNIYEQVTAPEVLIYESRRIGYSVNFKTLNAKDFGVPQNRPRVIFLGHRAIIRANRVIDLVVPPIFPTPTSYTQTVEDAISDLRFLTNGKKATKYDGRYAVTEYQQKLRDGLTPDVNGRTVKSEMLTNHKAAYHQEKTIARFRMFAAGEDIETLMKRLDPEDRKALFTKKYRCDRLDKDTISPTVLTLPDDIIHYDQNNPRILTVRELARLQSFDDSFEFLGLRTSGGHRRRYQTPQYTQVGNAVPPLFAKAIAEQIMVALQATYSHRRLMTMK